MSFIGAFASGAARGISQGIEDSYRRQRMETEAKEQARLEKEQAREDAVRDEIAALDGQNAPAASTTQSPTGNLVGEGIGALRPDAAPSPSPSVNPAANGIMGRALAAGGGQEAAPVNVAASGLPASQPAATANQPPTIAGVLDRARAVLAIKQRHGMDTSMDAVKLQTLSDTLDREGATNALALAHAGDFKGMLHELNNNGQYVGWSMQGEPEKKDFDVAGQKVPGYTVNLVNKDGVVRQINTAPDMFAKMSVDKQLSAFMEKGKEDRDERRLTIQDKLAKVQQQKADALEKRYAAMEERANAAANKPNAMQTQIQVMEDAGYTPQQIATVVSRGIAFDEDGNPVKIGTAGASAKTDAAKQAAWGKLTEGAAKHIERLGATDPNADPFVAELASGILDAKVAEASNNPNINPQSLSGTQAGAEAFRAAQKGYTAAKAQAAQEAKDMRSKRGITEFDSTTFGGKAEDWIDRRAKEIAMGSIGAAPTQQPTGGQNAPMPSPPPAAGKIGVPAAILPRPAEAATAPGPDQQAGQQSAGPLGVDPDKVRARLANIKASRQQAAGSQEVPAGGASAQSPSIARRIGQAAGAVATGANDVRSALEELGKPAAWLETSAQVQDGVNFLMAKGMSAMEIANRLAIEKEKANRESSDKIISDLVAGYKGK